MKLKILNQANFSWVRIFARFWKYSAVGISTFLFDIFLIFLFKEFLQFNDVTAIALGFGIAISINFLLSYYWVFKGTSRHRVTGYLYFIGIAFFGACIVLSGTYLLHEYAGMNLYYARILVAGVAGIVNFFINTMYNFKVH